MLRSCKTILVLLLLAVTLLRHTTGKILESDAKYENDKVKRDTLAIESASGIEGDVLLKEPIEKSEELSVSENNKVKRSFQIYRGTLWCGKGNKAKSYSDLGKYRATDKCCRSHDQCFDNIPAGGTRHGLINTESYTLSHCDCDDKFYSCLKNDNSIPSKTVGKIYFDGLKTKCFRKVCLQKCIIGSGSKKRCSSSKTSCWQWKWFNAKDF